jgi:hypothetical protein
MINVNFNPQLAIGLAANVADGGGNGNDGGNAGGGGGTGGNGTGTGNTGAQTLTQNVGNTSNTTQVNVLTVPITLNAGNNINL